MARYEFQVRCAGGAHAAVRDMMPDFEIIGVDGPAIHDLAGVRDFEDAESAIRRSRELRDAA